MRLPERISFTALLGSALMIVVAAACSSDSGTGGSASSGLNIGLNNQSGHVINVTLTINRHAQAGISVNDGAYVTDEFPTPTGGSAISIDAVSTDGPPVLNFTAKDCTPKSTIINTTVYGQIDFTGLGTILCQDPNTWQ
jgi:hypothetical protein